MNILERSLKPGEVLTEGDLRRLADVQGFKTAASFFQATFLPLFKGKAIDAARTATSHEDLLRAQGQLQMLLTMEQHFTHQVRKVE